MTIKNLPLTDLDIRAIKNLVRTGMGFDDLRNAFSTFPIEEVDKYHTA